MTNNEEVLFSKKYKSLRRIGNGSCGEVFLVENIYENKKYAMKVLLNRECKSNFELGLLGRIKSPHIVEFFEYFYYDFTVCIVMEYCENGDIERKIEQKRKQNKKFDNVLIYKWICEIIKGIYYLHSNNIKHRDIKPSNIFLTSGYDIKIGDFGVLDCIYEDETTQTKQTCVGTFKYMSPEIRESRKYTFNTDVWSAGCVLFELITLDTYYDFIQKNNLLLNDYESTYKEGIDEKFSKLLILMLKYDCKERASSSKLMREIESNNNKIDKLEENKSALYDRIETPNNTVEINKFKKINRNLIINNIINHKKLFGLMLSIILIFVLGAYFFISSNINKTVINLDMTTIAINYENLSITITNETLITETTSVTKPITTNVVTITNETLITESTSVTKPITTNVVTITNEPLITESTPVTQTISSNALYSEIISFTNFLTGVHSVAVLTFDQIVSGDLLGTVKIWNITKGNPIRYKSVINYRAFCLCVSNNIIVSGHGSGDILIWYLDFNNHTILSGHTDYVKTVKISNDILLSGSDDSTIKVWNITTGELIKTIQNHTDQVRSIDVLPTNIFISSSLDGTIKMWNLTDYSLLNTIYTNSSILNSAILPNNNYIVSVSTDKKIKIWNLNKRELNKTIDIPNINDNENLPLAMLSNNRLAIGHDLGITIMNYDTDEYHFIKSNARVSSLAVLKNGNLVSSERTSFSNIRIWQT